MVTVRPAADVRDVRAAIAVNRRGWRAAFEDILPPEALPDAGDADDGDGDGDGDERERERGSGGENESERGDESGSDGENEDGGRNANANDGRGVSWAQAAAVYGEHADEEATRYLVAESEDGSVVGYALFVRGEGTKDFVDPDANEAELRALYVAPERWGEGIGTRLLEAGIEDLPASAERLKLETFAANDRGRTFYRARGFEAVGESTFEVEGTDYPTVVFGRSLRASTGDQ
jgi:GNAT superfamily N-acetyltransferase